MKRLTATLMAALMVLTVFAGVASAADSVEVRGPVYNGSSISDIINNTPITIDAQNFAGFWYDIDENTSTEMLTITDTNSNSAREIGDEDLTYTTYINQTDYEADAFNNVDPDGYNIMGFFAEEYVPLFADTPDKLAKLMLDNDDKYTLRVGESIDLGNGYELTAQQVDVDGEQVWMELTKDGEFVDDNIFDLAGETNNETWVYEADDVLGEDDVPVLMVDVTAVFQGQVDSLAQIEGLWMVDWENAMEIESDDERGELEMSTVGNDYLEYYNSDSITLSRDDTIDIAEDMKFLVADNNSLRYYPFVERTIEGEEPVIDDTGDEEDETNVTDDETNETEDTTGDVEDTTNETDTTGDGEDEGAGIPGFEAVFAIAGLLAVAYLVRRN
jgi:S-layer protein (TIGR01567 family)